jgi:hypothetical protein
VFVEWLGSELTTTPTRTVTTHLGAFQMHPKPRIDGRLTVTVTCNSFCMFQMAYTAQRILLVEHMRLRLNRTSIYTTSRSRYPSVWAMNYKCTAAEQWPRFRVVLGARLSRSKHGMIPGGSYAPNG